ncbi:hypothetical protein [Sphingomonas lenta]|uniref:hypothetical protein n=1 Tax=Sphingomonas lenta TaxID=1141887 RepID=UPI001595A608|nr:hypothetical protein [Sphingomonas lenta]
MNVASVSGGAEPGTAPAWEVAVQAGAGPAVTMLLTVAAIATARRGGSRSAAFALAAVAPVRMLMAPIGLLTWSLAALDLVRAGRPNFDEYNFAIAVGAPTPAILLPSSLFLGWAWLRVWRQLPSPRPVHILWLVTGMVAGLAGWVKLVGPVAVALIR